MRIIESPIIGTPPVVVQASPNILATQIREPNLLIPGKKPVGAVKIDWSHPIGKDITGYFLLNDFRDHADNGKEATLGQGPITKIDGKGYEFDGDATEENIEITNPRFRSDVQGTVFTKVYLGSASRVEIISHDGTTFPQYRNVFEFEVLSDGRIYSRIYDNSAVIQTIVGATGVDIAAGNTYSIALTYDKNSGICRLYADGVETDNSSSNTYWFSDISQSTDKFRIGVLNIDGLTNYTYPFDGIIYYVGVVNRPLSASEIMSLHQDPYQFLIPA